jgi:hypothetical protein
LTDVEERTGILTDKAISPDFSFIESNWQSTELAVGSSNPLLVHSLIVCQLSPYVRTNRNHKQTYEFLIQACAFKHQRAHTAWDSGANLEILLIAGTF